MIIALRLLGTLVAAAFGWVVLGYLATGVLGAMYGWGGHPAIPAAPMAVYVVVYGVVLPILCLAGAWKVTGRIETRWRRSRGT